MKNNQTTAQQQSDRVLPLSAADVQERLKDPNSLEFKQYNDCLLESVISFEEFVRLIRVIKREQRLVREAFEAKEGLHAEREQKNENKYYAELYLQQCRIPGDHHQARAEYTSTPATEAAKQLLSSLQASMAVLLATPQHTMNAAQLAAHHNKITANFNNQIAAALGPVVNMPVKINGVATSVPLVVPMMTSKPMASVPDILKYSPSLPRTSRFAAHASKSSVSYLATINKVREILEGNRDRFDKDGVNIDRDIQLTPLSFKATDKATRNRLDANPGVVEHLAENNFLQMGYSVSELPTLFKKRPMMIKKRPLLDEENDPKHLSKIRVTR